MAFLAWLESERPEVRLADNRSNHAKDRLFRRNEPRWVPGWTEWRGGLDRHGPGDRLHGHDGAVRYDLDGPEDIRGCPGHGGRRGDAGRQLRRRLADAAAGGSSRFD